MAKGINKVILIGNLGKDPEVRYMTNGEAVANLTLATSDSWKDKATGEQQERTEWHNLVFYRRLAEIAGEYLKKGSKIYVEGKLQTRKWQDKNSGTDRYTTEIIVNEMQMLDGRGAGSGHSSSGGGGGGDYNEAPQQGASRASGTRPAPTQTAPAADEFDDDIPF